MQNLFSCYAVKFDQQWEWNKSVSRLKPRGLHACFTLDFSDFPKKYMWYKDLQCLIWTLIMGNIILEEQRCGIIKDNSGLLFVKKSLIQKNFFLFIYVYFRFLLTNITIK